MTTKSRQNKTTAKCPICAAETLQKWRPFCSKRCADVDLGRWMNGGYVIPTEEAAMAAGPEDE